MQLCEVERHIATQASTEEIIYLFTSNKLPLSVETDGNGEENQQQQNTNLWMWS